MKTKYTIYYMLIALATLSAPISAEHDIAGDVNNDGIITTADSLLALRMAVGSAAPEMDRADVNADGRINSLDALMIQKMAEKTQVCVNSPEVVSGAFEVTIDIHNVDDLDSGQFDLSFNSSVVTVTAVHDGDISGRPVPVESWDFRDAGTIRVLFNLPGATGVSGSGCVAKISFELKGLHGDSCALDISQGLLINNRAEMIPAIWNDCEVKIGEYTPLNRVHNLNTGENFSFIQAAIDDPDTLDGHVIEVEDGVYRENVNVTKSLTIRSLNGSTNCVIQDAGGDRVVDRVVTITVDHVSISGFTVKGLTESTFGEAGIYLDASYCNVSDNNCSNNWAGIHLFWRSTNNSISRNSCSNNFYDIRLDDSNNNKLTGNTMFESGIFIQGDSLVDYTHEMDESNTVNGKPVYYWKDIESGRIPDGAGQVILVDCTDVLVEDQELNNVSAGVEAIFSSNITIQNNICSNINRYGIRLYGSINNRVSSNNCSNNNRYGIRLIGSSNNYISSNDCLNNMRDGVHLVGSNNNSISSNDCSNNNEEGIHLSVSNNNYISSNDCSDNCAGIVIDGSDNNSILRNNYSNNWCTGIYFVESRSNVIYLNNFINEGNNVDSESSSNIWNSIPEINYTYDGKTFTNYLGNYWDDHSGTDVNNDGIGDTPQIVDGENDNYPLMMPIENYFVET